MLSIAFMYNSQALYYSTIYTALTNCLLPFCLFVIHLEPIYTGNFTEMTRFYLVLKFISHILITRLRIYLKYFLLPPHHTQIGWDLKCSCLGFFSRDKIWRVFKQCKRSHQENQHKAKWQRGTVVPANLQTANQETVSSNPSCKKISIFTSRTL